MADKRMDLDALAEAFAGVRKLGAPPPKRAPVSANSSPPPGASASVAAPSPPPADRGPTPLGRPGPPAAPPLPDELDLLRDAMRGVRPLGAASAKGAAKAPARPAPVPATLAPRGPVPGPASAERVPRELADALQRQLDAALARAAAAEAELGRERSAHAAIEAAGNTAQARADALAADLYGAKADLAAMTDRAREFGRAAAELRAELEARSAEPKPGLPQTLKALAAARGLLSEDELAVALRALLDAHRAAPLYELLVARNNEAVAAFLAERLVLAAEGEAPPSGVVAVRVPAERSELKEEGAIRKALDRFSTACLVNGKKRVVFVGGSPSYRRQLREGLDPRIDVRFVEGDQRRIPKAEADLVIVWGGSELDHTVSNQFPDAIYIPHRGIGRMLTMAVERLDGAPAR